MQNPWINLPTAKPYLLDIDQDWEQDYSRILEKRASKYDPERQKNFLSRYKLHLEEMPIPYYGDPNLATVAILQANPGHDPKEQINPLVDEYLEYNRENLLHKNSRPLYSMSPHFRSWQYKDGTLGKCWYWKRTRELREVGGWEQISKKLIYLEFFPYRSISLFYPKKLPPSQEYTFALLREMIKRNVWIIATRMKSKWIEHVPELSGYERLLSLHSSQNVTLSRKNIGDKFDDIIKSFTI